MVCRSKLCSYIDLFMAVILCIFKMEGNGIAQIPWLLAVQMFRIECWSISDYFPSNIKVRRFLSVKWHEIINFITSFPFLHLIYCDVCMLSGIGGVCDFSYQVIWKLNLCCKCWWWLLYWPCTGLIHRVSAMVCIEHSKLWSGNKGS